jgi:stringent starvation protein B
MSVPLLQALYNLMIEYDLTPHILIDAESSEVKVPSAYVEGGRINLKIAPKSIHQLRITHQAIEFQASFNQQVTNIYAPTEAVLAVYAHSNYGQSIVFTQEAQNQTPTTEKKPKLSIVT